MAAGCERSVEKRSMTTLLSADEAKILDRIGLSVELIDPFIEQTILIFGSMLCWRIKQQKLTLKPKYSATHDVTGLVGLSGTISGIVALGLSREIACRMLSELLGKAVSDVNDEVSDVVGEITNTIVGRSTAQILTHDIGISLPTVLVGESKAIGFARETKPMSIEFETPWGLIDLELGLNLANQ